MNIFTMIGSKGTRDNVLELGFQLSVLLLENKWHGYSGNAPGMDRVLNRAMIKTNTFNGTIFLPWKGFELADLPDRCFYTFDDKSETGLKCVEIIKEIIPWFGNLRAGGIKLHSRDILQVKGADLNTLTTVVIHSAKGSSKQPTGGTRTAIVLSRNLNIPEFNIRFYDDRMRLKTWLMETHQIDASECIDAIGDGNIPDKGFN